MENHILSDIHNYHTQDHTTAEEPEDMDTREEHMDWDMNVNTEQEHMEWDMNMNTEQESMDQFMISRFTPARSSWSDTR